MRTWLVGGATILTVILFASPADAVQISPLRETRVVAPGSVERFEVQITNDSSQTATYTGNVDAFRIDPVQGTPIFGEYSPALPWFTPGPNITLRPGELGTLWFSLSVPAGAPPASFYLALFASEKNVRTAARVGTLLFLRTEGETREALTLQSLIGTIDSGVKVRARVDNTGDIHVVPRGQITLAQPFTGFQQTIALNPDKHMILPGEFAAFSWQFAELPWYAYGRLRIQADLLYGYTNQTLVHSIVIWRLPPVWFLLLIASIIGISVVTLIMRKQSHAFS